jgi:endonuclease/exonuclease/phosphatase (EEP) superfamily protein YafD
MPMPGVGTLRLMSVNQLRGNSDTARTQALIQSENPDIVAFQEYALEHDRQLSAALAIAFPYTARFPFPETNGLAVYSRYPMTVEHSPSMEFGAGRIMSVKILAMGREVVLYNIHPTSPGTPSRIAANRRQLSQLLPVLKRETRPTIVIGDCNFPLNSQQTQELRDAGLHPADDFGGEGLLWSWSPLPNGPPVTRIDHAFVSSHFAVSSNRIGAPVGSDHRPILVDVQLLAERY